LPAFLPFIEQQAIYDLIKTSVDSTVSNPCKWIWDYTNTGATTVRIGAQPITAVQCPSDSEVVTKPNNVMARINYRPILGDTMLPGGLLDCKRSLFRKGNEGETNFSSITDGTSNSVVLAESAVAFDFSKKTHIIGGAGIIASGFSTTSKPSVCTALIAGGGLMNSTALTTEDQQKRMYGRRLYDGRMPLLSLVTVLPPNSPTCGSGTTWDGVTTLNTVSSYHPGGANVTLADASVRFISQTIDAGDPNQLIATVTGISSNHYKDYSGPSIWGVWGALGTINCGESKSP
jgi:prepilin-type processing-associated H-X9-DG protein